MNSVTKTGRNSGQPTFPIALALEPRFMFDAAGAATGADAVRQTTAQDGAQPADAAPQSDGDAALEQAATDHATAQANVAALSSNAAPTMTDGVDCHLFTMVEGVGGFGKTVGELLAAAGYTDPEGMPGGIAIYATEGAGTWRYQTNWTEVDVGYVHEGHALLLSSTATLRYSAGQDSETARFYFRVWDGTTGAEAQKVDITANGGDTAFSSERGSAFVNVVGQNDPASLSAPGSSTVTEQVRSAVAGIAIHDVDNFDVPMTLILSVGTGVLDISNLGGATIEEGALGTGSLTLRGTMAQLNTALANLAYTSTSDTATSDSLTIHLVDHPYPSSQVTQTVALIIDPVNDAPVVGGIAAEPGRVSGPFSNIQLLDGVTVGDPDNPAHFAGGELTISPDQAYAGSWGMGSSPFSVGQDVGIGTVTASGQSGGVLTIEMDSRATPQAVQAFIRNLQYSSSAPYENRSYVLSLSDSSGSNQASTTVSFTLQTQSLPPIVAGLDGAHSTYVENGDAVRLQGGNTTVVTAGASADFEAGVITVKITNGQAGDLLAVLQGNGLTVAGSVISYNGVEIARITQAGAGTQALVLTLSAGATAADASRLLAQVAFRATGEAPVEGTRSISITVAAGSGQDQAVSDVHTVTVDVAGVNDAPSITPGTTLTLPTVEKYDPVQVRTVQSILDQLGYSDADGDLGGIAVIGSAGAHWLYSTNGVDWGYIAPGGPDANSALLLGRNVLICVDNSTAATATLTVRAWDGTTGGSSGAYVDLSAPSAIGGSTAFSEQTAVLQQTVNEKNYAPTILPFGQMTTTAEDTPLELFRLRLYDDEDTDLVTLTVAAPSGHFSFAVPDGMTIVVGGTPGALTLTGAVGDLRTAISERRLTWTPDANMNGTVAISVTLAEAGRSEPPLSADLTLNINVTPADDAPILGHDSVRLPAQGFDLPPPAQRVEQLFTLAGGREVDGDPVSLLVTGWSGVGAWEYSTDGGHNWSVIGDVGQSPLRLDAGTLVRFQAEERKVGEASLTFRAWDGHTTSATAATVVQPLGAPTAADGVAPVSNRTGTPFANMMGHGQGNSFFGAEFDPTALLAFVPADNDTPVRGGLGLGGSQSLSPTPSEPPVRGGIATFDRFAPRPFDRPEGLWAIIEDAIETTRVGGKGDSVEEATPTPQQGAAAFTAQLGASLARFAIEADVLAASVERLEAAGTEA